MGKASEIWKEIKPKIGEMLVAVNDIETQAEKAQEEAYQRGLNDAWEYTRKICAMDSRSRDEVFGAVITGTIIGHNSASEAIEKIKAYEQKQEQQIQVWDEVKAFERKPFIVTGFGYGDEDTVYCHGFVTENGISTIAKKDECVKTGRHFPEIAEVLKKMRESE